LSYGEKGKQVDTLVLNADARPYSILPLSTISWQESVKQLVLERVTVLEWYDDWIISSPSWETKVPAVVIVKDYIKKNTTVRFSKYNLFLRDQFTCQYCDEQLPHRNKCTVDHVVPVSRGGTNGWSNCVTACGPCNVAKGDKLHPKPRREPYKPTYYDLIKNKELLQLKIKHSSWHNYIR
jgi:5-methylcytosine-specific restriction endonuclease McrA